MGKDASMDQQELHFFEEGIENNLADIRGWHLRATSWIQRNSVHDATNHAYHVKALFRWRHQMQNVDNARECLMRTWDGEQPLTMTGHSNGCDILCRLLASYPDIKVKCLNLIAAATECSFEDNALNEVCQRGQVQRIRVWCSRNDEALTIARETHWIKRIWSRWGYGYLGLVGPTEVHDLANVVTDPTLWFPGYRHSDYFNDANFDATMRLILNG